MTYRKGERGTQIALAISVVVVLMGGCGPQIGDDPAAGPEAVFEAFWTAYDRHYAHFHLKPVDWDEAYEQFRPQVQPHTEEEELFEILASMMTLLDDGHVYLVGGERRVVSNQGSRSRGRTFERRVAEGYLDQVKYRADRRITYGRIGERVGYLRLSTLSGGTGFDDDVGGWIEEVDAAIDDLSQMPAMIVDLRGNGGGRASNAQYVAAHFADKRRPFVVTRSRSGPGHGDFSAPQTWYVEPRESGSYDHPVVVLTDRSTFSAAEWLTLALRQFEGVTHLGMQSGGGLAMFLPRQLPNGWMHTVSVQDTRCPLGNSYERVGITPHRHVENTHVDLEAGRDRMLEEAVKYLERR